MITHTPGPWAVVKDDPEFYDEEVDIEKSGAPNIIARVFPQSPFDNAEIRAETVATAHLIAAAPELLEACRLFVKEVVVISGRGKTWVEQAKMAIAKAEGKEGT